MASPSAQRRFLPVSSVFSCSILTTALDFQPECLDLKWVSMEAKCVAVNRERLDVLTEKIGCLGGAHRPAQRHLALNRLTIGFDNAHDPLIAVRIERV